MADQVQFLSLLSHFYETVKQRQGYFAKLGGDSKLSRQYLRVCQNADITSFSASLATKRKKEVVATATPL
jgi:hypothetical protein